MNKKPNMAAVKSTLHKDKFKHGSLSVIFTAVFIAVIVLVNVLVSALTERFPSMNIDMTLEGLNTLSEEALDVAKNVEEDTTIYIIGSEEAIRNDQVYANYNVKYSQVANLADRLQEANSKIKVEFIDPDHNPAFISEYPDDNLNTGKVMVKSEKRHKVLSVTDLFSIQQDQQTGQYTHFSKVDGALANALHLVNLDTVPVIAFATGHDEMLSISQGNLNSYTALLEDNNFEVVEFNMLTEDIPENASVVFIGTPTTDYTAEEIDKLEAFISDEAMASSRTLYFTAYPTQSWENMPNLAAFLEEWGLRAQSGVIQESDMNNVLTASGAQAVYLLANVNEEVLEGPYKNVVMPASAPIERVFDANNEIVTYSVVETSDTAYVTGVEEEMKENPETGKQTIVGLAQRYVNNTGTINANVVLDGCSMNYLSSYIGNSTFGNKAFTTDFIKNVTGVTDTRVGLSVKQTETNTIDITASSTVIVFVGLFLFTVIVPVAVLVAGLVVFLRRRHL